MYSSLHSEKKNKYWDIRYSQANYNWIAWNEKATWFRPKVRDGHTRHFTSTLILKIYRIRKVTYLVTYEQLSWLIWRLIFRWLVFLVFNVLKGQVPPHTIGIKIRHTKDAFELESEPMQLEISTDRKMLWMLIVNNESDIRFLIWNSMKGLFIKKTRKNYNSWIIEKIEEIIVEIKLALHIWIIR